MPQQLINVGAVPNDGTGDPLRTAYQKLNANDTELYAAVAGIPALPVSVANGGTGSIAYTAGSIPFSNGSALTQDNTNLIWDSTNKRLGIKNSSPSTSIDIAGKVQITETTPANAAVTTSAGLMFSANAAIPAGVISESGTNTGDILSYAINTPQVGTRDNTRVGGIFRLDTRSAKKELSVISYQIGSSVDTRVMSCGLDVQTVKFGTNDSSLAGACLVSAASGVHGMNVESSNSSYWAFIGGNTSVGNQVLFGGPDVVDFRKASGVQGTFIVKQATGYCGINNASPNYNLDVGGSIKALSFYLDYTNTATLGDVTINKPSGQVIMGSVSTSLTLTNSFILATSRINLTWAAGPTVYSALAVAAGAGSATITCGVAPGANTAINFEVIN